MSATNPGPASEGPNEPNAGDEFDALVLDDDFVNAGAREESAEVRLERLARIGNANDRLKSAGEIADGTGKPAARRMRKAMPWVVFGAVAAVVIVVAALIAR